MREVIIHTPTWLNGAKMSELGGDSVLLADSGPLKGMKCCLGFALEQLVNATADQILSRDTPSAVYCTDEQEAKLIEIGLVEPSVHIGFVSDTPVCQKLMDINDDPTYRNEVTRKRDLNKAAKEIGLKFRFTTKEQA